MKASISFLHAGALALLMAAAGCDRGHADAASGVIQTRFPGQVTSGGGTSGQVLARNARPVTDSTYAGGTPGIAGGAGGTTGGAATAGAVQETGQGPSKGTSQPQGTGQPGATPPPGDMNKPATRGEVGAGAAAPERDKAAPPAAAVHRDNPPPAAPGH